MVSRKNSLMDQMASDLLALDSNLQPKIINSQPFPPNFNKNSLIHIQKLLNGHTGAKSWRQKVGLVHHNKDLQLLLNYIKYY